MTYAEKILAEAGRIDAEKDKIKSVYEAGYEQGYKQGYEQGKTDYSVEIITGTVTPASNSETIPIITNKGKIPKFAIIKAIDNLPSSLVGMIETSSINGYLRYLDTDVYMTASTYYNGILNLVNMSGLFERASAARLTENKVTFGTGATSMSICKFVAGVTYSYKIVFYNE